MSGTRRGRNSFRPQHIEVHANDVLNGRGVKIAQHSGNLRFRALVKHMHDESYCEDFSSSEKKALARKIIDHIKKKLNPSGRFLKRHGLDGPWVELTKAETEKKTKQALRDCNRPDRIGYANQVTAPQDVNKADMERKKSGLTLQEYARRQVDEESRKTKTRGSNNNRKPPPTSGAALRPSRQSSQGGSDSPVIDEKPADIHMSNPRTEAPLELPFQQSIEAVTAESVSSTSQWAIAPSTVNATPAVRPYMDAAPVTQTPNPSSYSYLPTNGHDHHQINHSGSQATINTHTVPSYHDHYPPRDNFPDHHPLAAQAGNSLARFSSPPSPIVRSPIVTESNENNTRIFEEQHAPFQDEWTTGHHRQNLFPPEDPLDFMVASASENLTNDRSDVDFMSVFGDVPDSSF